MKRALWWACLQIGLLTWPDISQATSPTDFQGDWRAPAEDVDDVDAIITLTRQGESWTGHIKSIVVTRPDQKFKDDSVCHACAGRQHDQPFKGLQVIWDMKEFDGQLASGSILDPSDGQVYRCVIEWSADHRSLQVTAYKGLKLLGHTMQWSRP